MKRNNYFHKQDKKNDSLDKRAKIPIAPKMRLINADLDPLKSEDSAIEDLK